MRALMVFFSMKLSSMTDPPERDTASLRAPGAEAGVIISKRILTCGCAAPAGAVLRDLSGAAVSFLTVPWSSLFAAFFAGLADFTPWPGWEDGVPPVSGSAAGAPSPFKTGGAGGEGRLRGGFFRGRGLVVRRDLIRRFRCRRLGGHVFFRPELFFSRLAAVQGGAALQPEPGVCALCRLCRFPGSRGGPPAGWPGLFVARSLRCGPGSSR